MAITDIENNELFALAEHVNMVGDAFPRIETINEAMPEISPKLKSEEGKPPRTEAMVKPTQTDVTTEQMVVAPKKNNTLLYLGIGAVLVVGFLIMRKK